MVSPSGPFPIFRSFVDHIFLIGSVHFVELDDNINLAKNHIHPDYSRCMIGTSEKWKGKKAKTGQQFSVFFDSVFVLFCFFLTLFFTCVDHASAKV